ncbi:lysylphosphatidylglycerol synthase domain-containing protein [Sphingomonas quercus]|uniref:Flippase-like domain-containing protein n=1 Tax=Sphingomonas quercus TaxID=2842451 RepID=A0ABS6BMD1_9SPHN|nr:flippase-like domain-containing protein [Sphingomonas quercus]
MTPSLARAGILLATLCGLAAAVWAFDRTGLGEILAVAKRVGVGGFLLYCLYSLGVFAVLGGAWLASAPDEPVGRIGLFAWARLVREAVADLLPFSQIGGIVVATRLLAADGVAGARVYASLIVDMTTEMAGQLVFTLFGAALLVTIVSGGGAQTLRPMILSGAVAMIALMIAFFVAQRSLLGLATRLAGHVLPQSALAMEGVEAELRRIYGRRRAVLAAFLLNLVGWVGSAAGAWIVLRLMGVELSFRAALSIESLIFMLRSVAFAVPGAIGVQEAAYALIGPLFGLPAESALALSLAKRARDLAIGLPTLAIWQFGEGRALLRGLRPSRK